MKAESSKTSHAIIVIIITLGVFAISIAVGLTINAFANGQSPAIIAQLALIPATSAYFLARRTLAARDKKIATRLHVHA